MGLDYRTWAFRTIPALAGQTPLPLLAEAVAGTIPALAGRTVPTGSQGVKQSNYPRTCRAT